jgi:hypothetical protein
MLSRNTSLRPSAVVLRLLCTAAVAILSRADLQRLLKITGRPWKGDVHKEIIASFI